MSLQKRIGILSKFCHFLIFIISDFANNVAVFIGLQLLEFDFNYYL